MKNNNWQIFLFKFLILLLFNNIVTGNSIKDTTGIEKHISAQEKLIEIKEQGNNYVISGQYTKAVATYHKALKMAENLKDTFSIASIYNNIGTAYKEIQNYEYALIFLKKAEGLIKRLRDKSSIADIYNTIGNIYYDTYKDTLALLYFEKSHTYRLMDGDSSKLATSYKNLAAYYLDIGNLPKGLEMISESIKIRTLLNDSSGIASSYLALGESYLLRKKYQPALEYLNKGFSYIMHNTPIYIKRLFYEDYTILYSETNDFRNAFKYQNMFIKIKDSILNIEKSKQLIEMQTKYETEKKEQQLQIKSLEIEKQRNKNKIQKFLFTGITLMIIILTFFIFYRNRQKQKAERIIEMNRQDKLRFKTMIDSEENERIRVAKELHDGLGQLLSSAKLNISSLEGSVSREDEYLLQNSSDIIDEAVKEVRSISHNMMPTALMNYGIVEAIEEQLRRINDAGQISTYLDKTNFSGKAEKETEIALYRIFQEIINNMIKHSQATKIDIIIADKNNKISIAMRDNGTGFDQSAIKESKGIGWQNIFSRVSMLNGKITINSQIGKGTQIDMIF